MKTEITVIANNQPGILKAVTEILFNANVNIEQLNTASLEDGSGHYQVMVKSETDLTDFLEELGGIEGVVEVK